MQADGPLRLPAADRRLCGLRRGGAGLAHAGGELRPAPLRNLPQKRGPERPSDPGGAGGHALRALRLYSFSLPPEELATLSRAAEAYTAAQIERGFPTLRFYRSLTESLRP